MADMQYSYDPNGAPRLVTRAGVPGVIPAAGGAGMPDMNTMLRYAAQQAEGAKAERAAQLRAAQERQAREDAAAQSERQARMALAEREMTMREEGAAREEREANEEVPLAVAMRHGPQIISGYSPSIPGMPGSVASGFMRRKDYALLRPQGASMSQSGPQPSAADDVVTGAQRESELAAAAARKAAADRAKYQIESGSLDEGY